MVTIFDFALGILVGVIAGLAVERIMGREPNTHVIATVASGSTGRWRAT